MMNLIKKLFPRNYEWVLYKATELESPDFGGLTVEVVGPGNKLFARQRRFMLKHMKALSLWRLLKWHRNGTGWFIFVSRDAEYVHYTVVTPGNRYRKIFPIINEPKALLIGPCLTEKSMRGQGLYPRVIRLAVATLKSQGYGPFYIHTNLANIASIRGMEKAGFTRCGVWAGKRHFLDLCVSTARTQD